MIIKVAIVRNEGYMRQLNDEERSEELGRRKRVGKDTEKEEKSRRNRTQKKEEKKTGKYEKEKPGTGRDQTTLRRAENEG